VANIAPLPELPSIVAEGGSQGLITLACLQDLSQARARWGQEADGFGSLFGATVVFPGIGDLTTLRAISARCGDVEVAVRSDTSGQSHGHASSRSRSVTWSTRRQPRLGVDAIAEGQPGQALVVGGPRPPVTVQVTPWFMWEPWRSLAGLRPPLQREHPPDPPLLDRQDGLAPSRSGDRRSTRLARALRREAGRGR